MHKRTLLISVLLVLAAGLFAVYGVETLRMSGGKTRQIAVIMKSGDIRSEFWQTFGEGVKAAAKRFDVNAEIAGPLSESDADGQIKAVNEAIAKKPDAIVLAATDEAKLKPSVDKIKKAGIKLVSVDTASNAGATESVIATDQTEAGKRAGLHLAGQLTANASKAFILKSANGAAEAAEREEGVRAALSGSPQAEYIGTFTSEGTEDRAYETAKLLLASHSDVKGIVCLNEKMTLGAARAIKEKALTGEIKLIGFDSSIYIVKLLEEGVVQATVVQKPFNMGFLSIKSAVQLLSGIKANPKQYVESLVITKDNMYSQQNQQLLFPIVER
ncbi:hypothetical protein SD70_06790 [Gordoniibacillus kamchatkensis]|uniref:Periplasmic binding protein domain-containing protein n=1 Tax=Gordoniibacillus kamchatkensis TaxID=1590651 RepID=A0ABR5AKN0_9BACL|nr:substrate-binding domain-containing protein [Paenibacillus sp. VKM B-2647]KIL41559.1 hypothetical protein SD70_06790 [Paenibacillus sp. VKM B-2647]